MRLSRLLPHLSKHLATPATHITDQHVRIDDGTGVPNGLVPNGLVPGERLVPGGRLVPKLLRHRRHGRHGRHGVCAALPAFAGSGAPRAAVTWADKLPRTFSLTVILLAFTLSEDRHAKAFT